MTDEILLEKRRKAAARAKLWRERHPEKVKDVRKRFYENHKDRCRASHISYVTANKEHRSSYMKQWRLLNKDKIKEQESAESVKERKRQHSRAYYYKNKEKCTTKVRVWESKNPDKVKAIKQSIRGRRRGAKGSFTAEEINYLLIRQYYMCWNAYCMCDLRTNPKALDHKVSLAKGGSNSIENLQWLCVPCNARKGTLSVDDWLKREEKRAA